MKKILAIMLCLVMCAGVLVGCSKEESTDTGVGTSGADTTVKESVLPEMDWGGKELVIGETNEFGLVSAVVTEDMTTTIGNAIYWRNARLKDKYNIEVKMLAEEDPATSVIRDAMSGESEIHILLDEVTGVKGALAQGVFADLTTVKYIDLNSAGWNSQANKDLSIRGYQYVATGDLNLHEKMGSHVLFCNLDMINNVSGEDIRQIVLDGNWTIEKMKTLVTNATVIDVTTGETSVYGLTNHYNYAFYNFLSAAYGVTICEKDDTDTPYFSFDDASMYEHTINAIDDLLKMYANSSTTYTARYGSTTPSAVELFQNKRSMFLSNTIEQGLSALKSGTSFAYSVIPYPKYDADGVAEYISSKLYNMSTLIAIPYYASDLDFAGFGLQALNELSGDVTYAYIEEQCKLKGSTDETDYKLMELALVDVTYDLGVVYNWGAIHIWIFTDRYDDASGTFSIPIGGVNNFATLWAADKILAHAELEEFLTNFTG